MEQPLPIFLSYAREDSEDSERLKKSLALLRRKKKIKFFDQWKQDILGNREENLMNLLSISKVVLLLLSNNFLADDECFTIQEEAMKLFKREQSIVIPVLLKECEWDELEELFRLQPLPRNRNFISNWDNHDQAFTHISDEIGKLVKKLAS